MTENKTMPTSVSVDKFLSSVQDDRKNESQILIDMMQKISNCEPVMWGSSIIGFDSRHYKYDSGREGETCVLGFSPRKAKLTIYLADGLQDYGDLLSKLGKHKISPACLYVNHLKEVDTKVLEKMVKRSYNKIKFPETIAQSVDSYQMNLPSKAIGHFKKLRQLAQKTLPTAKEVISYAIPAYQLDNVRPFVFISGWKDHVALYPVPKDIKLQDEIKPYIKGKGTLWFSLDKSLPLTLIKKVMLAHLREHKLRMANKK